MEPDSRTNYFSSSLHFPPHPCPSPSALAALNLSLLFSPSTSLLSFRPLSLLSRLSPSFHLCCPPPLPFALLPQRSHSPLCPSPNLPQTATAPRFYSVSSRCRGTTLRSAFGAPSTHATPWPPPRQNRSARCPVSRRSAIPPPPPARGSFARGCQIATRARESWHLPHRELGPCAPVKTSLCYCNKKVNSQLFVPPGA